MMEKEEIVKAPLVTVVMPAYNAEDTLAEAMHSVLNQTMAELELIVVDDCSGDGTLEIARQIARMDRRVRVIPGQTNMGVALVRNRAIEMSEGNYIAFLDSDDVWHPEKLEKQLQRMRDTGADICYTSYALVDETLHSVCPDYLVPDRVDYPHLLRENVIGCSTVLIRAEVLKSHPFRSDFYHEDYILWLELLRDGFVAVGQREILTYWRYRKNSRSFNKWKSMRNRWKIYRDYLGMSLGESLGVMVHYAYHGIRKYRHV